MISIEEKGEQLILAGDLNLKIGSYVEGNHPAFSVRGKLLIDLLSSGKYIHVNALSCVSDGPFTR